MSPGEATELKTFAMAARDKVERNGKLSDAVLGQLRSKGYLRFYMPCQSGGAGGCLSDGLRIVEALAYGCGSVGWVAMFGMLSPFVAKAAGPAIFSKIYADGPDAFLASSSICGGLVTPKVSGSFVQGIWPFVTGISHAKYFLGHAKDSNDNNRTYNVLIRTEDIHSMRPMQLIGLTGSDTCDVQIKKHQLGDSNVLEVQSLASEFIDLSYPRISLRLMFAINMAAVALGVCHAAADAFKDQQEGRNPNSPKRHGELAANQNLIGLAFAKLTVARHALYSLCDDLTSAPLNIIASENQLHAALTSIVLTLEAVTQSIWTHSPSAVLLPCVLQSCFRDMSTIARHANLSHGIFSESK